MSNTVEVTDYAWISTVVYDRCVANQLWVEDNSWIEKRYITDRLDSSRGNPEYSGKD